MTPDEIMSITAAEMRARHPHLSRQEVSRLRKRAINAIWQRKYRASGKDRSSHSTPYDGPAIGPCRDAERLKRNAVSGSQQLLHALQQAGLTA